MAAAALAGIAAAFVFLPVSGPAQAAPDQALSQPPPVTLPANRPDVTPNRLAATMHQTSAQLETRAAAARARAAAHRRHLAEIAAQKRAQQEQQTPAPVSPRPRHAPAVLAAAVQRHRRGALRAGHLHPQRRRGRQLRLGPG